MSPHTSLILISLWSLHEATTYKTTCSSSVQTESVVGVPCVSQNFRAPIQLRHLVTDSRMRLKSRQVAWVSPCPTCKGSHLTSGEAMTSCFLSAHHLKNQTHHRFVLQGIGCGSELQVSHHHRTSGQHWEGSNRTQSVFNGWSPSDRWDIENLRDIHCYGNRSARGEGFVGWSWKPP